MIFVFNCFALWYILRVFIYIAGKPHVLMILQDDLGHDDVSFHGNTVNLDVTGNITALASTA